MNGVRAAAQTRLDHLVMPAGALGRLGPLLVDLAALQDRVSPRADRVAIAVFAGDHGVARHGVSAYPQRVTVQMLDGLAGGGAAIAVLARQLKARLEIIDVGTLLNDTRLPGIRRVRIRDGTRDLMTTDAMTPRERDTALAAGAAALARARGRDLFIAGEIGIANTTAGAALAAALLRQPAVALVGRGTGIDDTTLARKTDVISQALMRTSDRDNPLDLLAALGGYEIAALVGAYSAAPTQRLPCLVDGFVCSVAALLAVRLNPDVRPWLLFGHQSAERGHRLVLDALQAQPILNVGMRLGEGTGAAMAVGVLRLACALHRDMATFEAAGVDGKA